MSPQYSHAWQKKPLNQICSCNPTGCNPSGCSSTKERKLEILKIAKRFGILILEGVLISLTRIPSVLTFQTTHTVRLMLHPGYRPFPLIWQTTSPPTVSRPTSSSRQRSSPKAVMSSDLTLSPSCSLQVSGWCVSTYDP